MQDLNSPQVNFIDRQGGTDEPMSDGGRREGKEGIDLKGSDVKLTVTRRLVDKIDLQLLVKHVGN